MEKHNTKSFYETWVLAKGTAPVARALRHAYGVIIANDVKQFA
jgi:hypothetical protein